MFENVPNDQELARYLAEANSPYDAAGVHALMRGVSAAASRDPVEWMDLVALRPTGRLADMLAALRHSQNPLPTPRPDSVVFAGRLAAVRKGMERLGIDAFLVPRSDEYQNEYVPAAAERLAWLTGFTGSAGLAVVMSEAAAIFVDGRYTLQIVAQVDGECFERLHIADITAEQWLGQKLKHGQKLGYDAWLMTPDQLQRYRRVVEAAGALLVPVTSNPLDEAWTDRPPAPLGPVMVFGTERAGKSASEKRGEIAANLKKNGSAAAVITAPDSIAWLLNIRGSDVPHTPLPLGFAVIDDEGAVQLFMDRRKLLPGVLQHLGNEVSLCDPEELGSALDALTDKRVHVDPSSGSSWIWERLERAGAILHAAPDPTRLAKACKNPVELDGIRSAHRRDGAAMVRFLTWLSAKVANGDDIAEIEASDRLEVFRADGEGFRDLSFDTISGAGPNGAIVHYRAAPETERRLERGSLYLLDSGAQYLDGTTDITRTIAIGTPNAEMKDRYTRVLKGHIALALAVFPAGTPGAALDVLARQSLWQAGLNYDHGTGHGVGHYLGVHEGPQRVHYQSRDGQALMPGMVISNEPGYYKAGAYGIRIENLLAVIPMPLAGAEREMLGFETLTLCPIDTTPIDLALLNAVEVDWLDRYHARVKASVGALLKDAAALAWLDEATKPVTRF